MTSISANGQSSQRTAAARVLVLNSTVVSGFAGAKSCTFPMQALGLDVDCIYTTQHSNHSGYSHVSKTDIPRDGLVDLFHGLEVNNLLANRYGYFFSGFVADEKFLHDVVDMYKKLKAVNQNAKWFCDTVIGDRDSKTGQEIYYCPKALIPLYREYVLPLADVITPNQLELELLAKHPIKTRQDAIQAMATVHSRGVGLIVLTSVSTEHGSEMLTSHKQPEDSEQTVFKASFTEMPYHFTGTGDCMMGLLVGNMHLEPNDVALASSRALSTIQAIMKRSVDSIPKGLPDSQFQQGLELKIVQSLSSIVNPPSTHELTRVL